MKVALISNPRHRAGDRMEFLLLRAAHWLSRFEPADLLLVTGELTAGNAAPEPGFLEAFYASLARRKSELPVIFPGMPLIITGILLRERGLWWLGVGMAVLGGILSLGGILLTGYPQPASRQVLLSIGALGLLQYFFQPAALLLLARRLKRRPEGA